MEEPSKEFLANLPVYDVYQDLDETEISRMENEAEMDSHIRVGTIWDGNGSVTAIIRSDAASLSRCRFNGKIYYKLYDDYSGISVRIYDPNKK